MNLEQPVLPFTGRTQHSRHAGYTGAVVARKSRGVKTQLYLQWLRTHGPATDHAAHDATGLPLTPSGGNVTIVWGATGIIRI